jgi:hypothetical protein
VPGVVKGCAWHKTHFGGGALRPARTCTNRPMPVDVKHDDARHNSGRLGQAAIYAAAATLIIHCVVQYCRAPSFWLDESFVAASLRHPSARHIFAPLQYSQFFPRFYLGAIAIVRELFGYSVRVVRFLPSLSFVIATGMWAYLLSRRARHSRSAALLAGALLLGATFWIDQSIQLKQYTFDVAMALLPFLVSDEFLVACLVEGESRHALALLAIPCALSYTYPFALTARIVGWYAQSIRVRGWRVSVPRLLSFLIPVTMCIITIWAVDYRHNLPGETATEDYWRSCILTSQLDEGIPATARLMASFLWGWHGRMPVVTIGIVILQTLGVSAVLRRWWAGSQNDDRWGSRSLGSIVLLGGVVLASLLFKYPICSGRLVLFTQIHTEILAIEGSLCVVAALKQPRRIEALLYAFASVVSIYGVSSFVSRVEAGPAENISEMVAQIKPEVADSAWVHPCSCAQVGALPVQLPVRTIVLGTNQELPDPGTKTWIIWTHMGERTCRGRLARLRCLAKEWQVIEEGNERGLVLAQF